MSKEIFRNNILMGNYQVEMSPQGRRASTSCQLSGRIHFKNPGSVGWMKWGKRSEIQKTTGFRIPICGLKAILGYISFFVLKTKSNFSGPAPKNPGQIQSFDRRKSNFNSKL